MQVPVRLRRNLDLQKLTPAVSPRLIVPSGDVQLAFDGHLVPHGSTPASLGLEEGDLLELVWREVGAPLWQAYAVSPGAWRCSTGMHLSAAAGCLLTPWPRVLRPPCFVLGPANSPGGGVQLLSRKAPLWPSHRSQRQRWQRHLHLQQGNRRLLRQLAGAAISPCPACRSRC